LEELFREYLRHMITVVINPKGTGKLNVARVDEYVIFCVPNNGTNVLHGIPSTGAGNDKPGKGALFYPDSVNLPLEASDVDDSEDEDESDNAEENGDEDSDEDTDTDSDAVEATEGLPFPADERDEWELRHARRRGGESS